MIRGQGLRVVSQGVAGAFAPGRARFGGLFLLLLLAFPLAGQDRAPDRGERNPSDRPGPVPVPTLPGLPTDGLLAPVAGEEALFGAGPSWPSRVETPWHLLQQAEEPVTPRGAFLRSLVVPGWGHLAAESPTRAAFYVAAQGGAGWMLGKSVLRQRNARRFRAAEFETVRNDLVATGIPADSARLRAANDPRVGRWDDLIEIRGEQVEDWMALSLFLALLGATDALVAAHLVDFPEPLAFRVLPGTAPGRVELGFSLPWPVGGTGASAPEARRRPTP